MKIPKLQSFGNLVFKLLNLYQLNFLQTIDLTPINQRTEGLAVNVSTGKICG